MKIRPYYFLVVVLVLLSFFTYKYVSKIFLSAEESAYMMGTPVLVKVEGINAYISVKMAMAEIQRLESNFSNRDPQSEISLLNKFAGLAPLQVSRETLECLNIAVQMNKLTHGAFDVTLGNPKALVIDNEMGKAFIKKQGVKIDLGAIGKGYAAEHVRRLLLENVAQSGMIDMRSSIAVFGKKPRKIGIQHPGDQWKMLGMVELKDGESLATSGNYERGEHIIDPRTGKPAESCKSVTIIGKNAAQADALSTAVFVLGPKAGIDLIESLPENEALVLDRNDKLYMSSGFIFTKP